MLAVRAIKHEKIFELANMVPARMAVLVVDFLLNWLFEVLIHRQFMMVRGITGINLKGLVQPFFTV
jgi:hypothetical protein